MGKGLVAILGGGNGGHAVAANFAVPTPTHDAVIQLASAVNRADYWKTGRGVRQLGLSKLDKKGLKRFLLEGRR